MEKLEMGNRKDSKERAHYEEMPGESRECDSMVRGDESVCTELQNAAGETIVGIREAEAIHGKRKMSSPTCSACQPVRGSHRLRAHPLSTVPVPKLAHSRQRRAE